MPQRRRFLAFCLLVALASLAVARPCPAQGLFGKNKVTYDRRDWFSIRTEHCEVFYYSDEEGLAREVAAIAESTAAEYDTTFRMRPRKRIPILSYASHQAFQQSHAASGFIGEGTGGLTELIRGRVLIPHTGSTPRLVWVTRHELVHAYMIEKLSQIQHKTHKYHTPYPPLWFTEGLAEFLATTWDATAEGLMQDAVVTGVALPINHSLPIEGTVLMYKEGQSFLDYVALHNGGKRRVVDVFDHWTEKPTFDEIWKQTFGRSLDEMDKEWFEDMRKRYYPAVATRRPVREIARPLTSGEDSYNLAPCVLQQAPGDSTMRIAYLKAEDGAVDLRLRTEVNGKKIEDERLLRGGFTSKFESFHFFKSRLGASRDGRLAIVAQRGGSDVLHLYDVRRRVLTATWSFPGIVGLTSPTWLAGDSALVVVGQAESGRTDLYRVRAADGAMTALTHDDSDEEDPTAHPTRPEVVFASDREGGRPGHYHLFSLDLASGAITQLTSGTFNEKSPTWSPDGTTIAFLSDRVGIDDLWLWKDGRTQRASRFLGPSYDPSWRPDGHALLFAGQARWEFHLYEVPLTPVDSLWTAEPTDSMRAGAPLVSRASEPGEVYRRRYGLDIAQSVVALDPALGAGGGGGLIALSDVLGDTGYTFYLANDASTISSFLDGFELGVTYFNRAQRLNYGVGAFRLTREYDPDFDLIRRERRIGGSLLAEYPIDKFTRIEGSAVLRYAQDHLLRNGEFRDLWLLSNFAAIVRDDARFTYYGPAGGQRINLTLGYTRDLSSGQGDSYTVTLDARKYFTLVPQVTWATRLVTQNSFGDDQERFYLGGPYSVRGWDRRTINGTKTAFAQTEIRFPLLRRFQLGIPAPIEFPQVSVALLADAAVSGGKGITLEKIGNVGAGVYIGGGYFPVLRFDFVKRTNLVKIEAKTRTRFTIGYNF
jgi:hypothetical protein